MVTIVELEPEMVTAESASLHRNDPWIEFLSFSSAAQFMEVELRIVKSPFTSVKADMSALYFWISCEYMI